MQFPFGRGAGAARRGRTMRRAALAAAGLLALGACSPTFNWRALRIPDTPLSALMPCKPQSAERTLPLVGVPTVMHMLSCEAGGHTFALAWAGLDDASKVPDALEGWRAGALAAIKVANAPAGTDSDTNWVPLLPGIPELRGVQAEGTGPSGQPVRMHGVYFARDAQVFQAAVYGQTLSDEALSMFFEGLKLP
jgi:hypothetical protein